MVGAGLEPAKASRGVAPLKCRQSDGLVRLPLRYPTLLTTGSLGSEPVVFSSYHVTGVASELQTTSNRTFTALIFVSRAATLMATPCYAGEPACRVSC